MKSDLIQCSNCEKWISKNSAILRQVIIGDQVFLDEFCRRCAEEME